MDEDREERKESKRRTKSIGIIEMTRETALIEWDDGGPRRGYVPAGKIDGGKCDQADLDAAAPYGVPWEKLIELPAPLPYDLANELRRRGVWTAADIETNMRAAQAAIIAVTGLTAAALHSLARQYELKK